MDFIQVRRLTMLPNILSSAFLLARDVNHGHGGDLFSADNVIADIEADFGLRTSDSDPFKQLEKELKSSILCDPFRVSVGSSFGGTSFGGSDSAFHFDQDPHDEAMFDGWYDSLVGCAVNRNTGKSIHAVGGS